ncbi:hypothetical protein ACHHYP_07442 [Achlya hypogyna]|uniref:Uncharacterized protein n=1 Tax=Achlya hypogyna TaxID=1202772 RepID=A0A1V9ZLY2_ACHHY|nr:hypothetical protein ACHHYP_07442 [Achlya hypogyna]
MLHHASGLTPAPSELPVTSAQVVPRSALGATSAVPVPTGELTALHYGKRSKKLRARQHRKQAPASPAAPKPPASQMQAALKNELLLLCFQIELLKHLQAAEAS